MFCGHKMIVWTYNSYFRFNLREILYFVWSVKVAAVVNSFQLQWESVTVGWVEDLLLFSSDIWDRAYKYVLECVWVCALPCGYPLSSVLGAWGTTYNLGVLLKEADRLILGVRIQFQQIVTVKNTFGQHVSITVDKPISTLQAGIEWWLTQIFVPAVWSVGLIMDGAGRFVVGKLRSWSASGNKTFVH